MCNGIFTIIQLCMFNAILGFVNLASAIFMLIMFVLKANIVMLCHTFFVVHAVKSAIVATCIQTVSSQYVILRTVLVLPHHKFCSIAKLAFFH